LIYAVNQVILLTAYASDGVPRNRGDNGCNSAASAHWRSCAAIAQKTLKNVHFSGFIPFNSKPRVAVDGYCDIKKT
jgi:hypothetical protein